MQGKEIKQQKHDKQQDEEESWHNTHDGGDRHIDTVHMKSFSLTLDQ